MNASSSGAFILTKTKFLLGDPIFGGRRELPFSNSHEQCGSAGMKLRGISGRPSSKIVYGHTLLLNNLLTNS